MLGPIFWVAIFAGRPIEGASPPELHRMDRASLLADRFGGDLARREAARLHLEDSPADDADKALAWAMFKSAPSHEGLRREFDTNVVSTPSRSSPYRRRYVGERPAEGWSLVIAMHGGGGVPKGVNDSQWEGMFKSYYKDHPEVGGYVYLALRAPNDEWNGFYDDAIAPLIERLILQFVLFGGVNADGVYILGASHGGYGAFVIGPKIPDRFAAIHASAAAPSPGETMGENLRNVRFTFMVGERDTAHGRADRCREFAQQFDAWRASHGGYSGGLEWRPDVGHSVPDRDKVGEMIRAGPRDPRPDRVIWVQSDKVIKHCYWIGASRPAEGGRIEASVRDNVVAIRSEGQAEAVLYLDRPLIDPARPVTVEVNGGKTLTLTPRPSLETYCLGLEERGDSKLATPVRLVVPLTP